MDFKTLMEAVGAMNDEELFLVEKKAHDESRRRAVNAGGGFATVGPGTTEVLIDLAHLTNAVRESLRQDMSLCSEGALASVLDQTKNYSEDSGDERVVTQLLRSALTATLIHEARCEAARRLDSGQISES